ncbi:MAG: ABC transporter substrate-binding protein [Lachnospiraceae bacterium]|nr:ABC transporter substrate-binding protein [Lachnospiraceae bacterium]
MSNSPVIDQERIMAKANEIIEKEIGVHLNLIMIDGSQYQEKMNLMINTGDAWDLCFTANWFDFYNHAGKGAYADLTELLPTLAPETYSRIPEGLWQAVKGKSTLEALEMTGEFIGKALEKHPDMIGWETAEGGPLWKSDGIYWDMEAVGDSQMAGWIRYEDPDTVINQFATDEFMEFCKIMRDWYEKGYVRKDGATVTDTTVDRKAAKFVAELCYGWPDSVDFPGNSDVSKMSMCEADTAPAVTVSTTRTLLPAGAGSTAAVAVNAKSENIEKAVELIELLNTNDELYMLITQGEEGVDYVYGEDGTFSFVDGKYNFNYNEWQIGQSYSPDFTRALYNKNEAGDKQKESQSIVFEADRTADVSPLSGFVFNPEPVKTQIANCTSILEEMRPALCSGSVDPETKVPELLERLEQAGVNDIIAEKQAQLDAWKAEN